MRVLISGYYGFGNLGDEALLDVIVAQLRTRHPYCEIDVLSAKPEESSHRLTVHATPRWDAKAVQQALASADVVLSGGGGLLQNATSVRSLLYYAGIIRSAAALKRRTMIFAQSIGPLDFIGKAIVKECCKSVAAATVRDSRSEQLLKSILPALRVERTADPVFLYEAPEGAADLLREGLGQPGEPYVVVSVRKSALRGAGEAIAQAVDHLAEAHGVRAAFLPLGGVPDAEVSTAIIRSCKSAPVLLPECSLERASVIIGSAQAVIGMRLHALILAARHAVPFLAIPYDPKVSALCEDLAYPLPSLLSAAPPMLADRLWNERESLSAHLREAAARMRVLAARNFDVLDEILAS